ncbi:1-acyl-sn-glycerol-3-phosphate acyltransferase [Anaerotignum lactatifermentans]|uniref:1-acyl-sn-glycerol-3-phosphate acyltransferase n=1 Tax=Anaerotignum lactatifermentans TaxID=160404 RepID=A0ABS2G7Q4_9FIRM|nr:lysophospholipid acyltransferase family protein [Anaerotignum lactatifermentans]MBM6828149.1 1-acyl-sn-glycerol-3-phosphate acyltransferase [Anaerotignum lactatifermentans]MBM6876688.1 1-acyl-sn-glycerol-3-phosphate acyltransferase [Anaerotignum lactatifermentans]MBM6949732.1 1-acyl-sn-glycerol-3-phosphate acyltransferase [Anaerotignum lactatifermentans]
MSLYPIAKNLVKIYMHLLFKIDIQGEERMPKEDGFVLCSNHMSNYDPLTVAAFIPRQVRFIAKKELFHKRMMAKLLFSLGAFPVDRETTDMKAFKTAIKLLKNNEVLGIFAEGTRVKEGEAKAAKAGVAMFAMKAGVPIVPVAVSSTYRFRSTVHIRYGEPISLEEYQGQKLTTELMEEITEHVMEKIREMKVKE